MNRPNIVLIMVDQMRGDCLGIAYLCKTLIPKLADKKRKIQQYRLIAEKNKKICIVF